MATNVLMPKWGLSMQEGTVLSWLKQPGDAVEKGEEIVEIESEKASNFVEAPVSGILAHVVVPEGATVPVTTVIAVIAADGEEIAALPRGTELPQAQVDSPPGVETAHAKVSPRAEAVGSRDSPQRLARRRIAASPAARRLARERGVDLSQLRGTGPEGMIRVEDVEAALAAPTSPGALVTRVAFYSDGHKLDGTLYLPKDRPADAELRAVVFCIGYTYTKELLVPEMARRLSAIGLASLIFDYRGFGRSEGPSGRVLPLEQVADCRAAITYLSEQPEVDASQVALVGISLGGSHAIYTAAVDDRVCAVAAISAPGNCRRWLRGMRSYWQWIEFNRQLEGDRTARVLGREGKAIDAWEIVVPDPQSRRFLDDLLHEYPALACKVSLELAGALLEYCPESLVRRISPRPLLLLHGNDDLLVPPDESCRIYRRARKPRDLVMVSGVGHFDWAVPGQPGFERVMQALCDWLATNLARPR